ncbi:MAG: hypothetical protein WCF33_24225 [Pseudonocardiaceae bacterium]
MRTTRAGGAQKGRRADGSSPPASTISIDVHDLLQKVCDLGMMLTILSNGSRLSSPKILDLITFRYPHRITLNVYGASAESYDGLTRRKGAFKMFEKGPCTPKYH